MTAKILDGKQSGAIAEAAASIKSGLLVAFPTDTLYGVGALFSDPAAINQIFLAKGRPAEKGIPVLVADAEDVWQVVESVTDEAAYLIERHWPGPLTLILPRREGLPANLTPNDTVAVRMPDNAIAREFIRAAGGALATTSANLSGQPAALSAEEALAALGSHVAIILDGGTVDHGIGSTIVDCTSQPIRIVREGPIKAEELLAEIAKRC